MRKWAHSRKALTVFTLQFQKLLSLSQILFENGN
ncbi:hypothetical protein CLV95_12513 [Leptospira borgpetersenii serovar Javanica]|nr:hypothetical protein CLV95_12513 [Leptospira borgpetersenii serovar Javanica]